MRNWVERVEGSGASVFNDEGLIINETPDDDGIAEIDFSASSKNGSNSASSSCSAPIDGQPNINFSQSATFLESLDDDGIAECEKFAKEFAAC